MNEENPYVPSKEVQAKVAEKAIELYDAISAMCEPRKGCPEPFATLMSILIRERFTLERIRLKETFQS